MRKLLGRRLLLAGLAGVGAGVAGSARAEDDGLAPAVSPAPPRWLASAGDLQEWQSFKRRFVAADGRVVDTYNGGISHTEGQGWGLLFAVAFDDPATFDLILDWTARHLRRPRDALHAWRYDPSAARPVADMNNATDGDVSIGSALWRAAHRWGRPDHAAAAAAIGRDVLALLVRQAGRRTLLLPGAAGFETAAALTVNPSYYCFPALADLAQAAPGPEWDVLRLDGMALLAEGRFGKWGLPPDWLGVARRDGALAPAAGWPARFSYDAIRVPLNLAWSKLPASPAQRAFAHFWSHAQPPPAWVDLNTGGVADYPAPAGMVAVASIAVPEHADVAPPSCRRGAPQPTITRRR
jgi:endoglucanase